MKVLTETTNYAVVNVPDGANPASDWNDAMKHMLNVCETLREKGYKPLHYVPRVSAWVCEKPLAKLRVD